MCAVWCIFVIPVILLIARKIWLEIFKKTKNVSIVVLGDLGRSPRMQYHAMSYAKEGFTVDFIGYPGSLPLKEIRDDPHIKIHYLREPPTLTDKLPTIVHYAIKVLWQAVTLLWILIYKRISSYLILQNPPTVPTIPVCWFYCILTDTKFMIDWHNYGYSLLALSLKKEHVLVKLAKFIESFFGSMADKNFCVTRAMKEDLLEKWGIEAHVLYDRPADNFHSILLEEKHEFLLKLAQKYDEFKGEIEDATIFTEKSSDGVRLLPHRPGFIVSSTSWTEDEDFSILLNALQDYENEADTAETSLPNLICAITGKGPLKEFYLAIIRLKKWKHVTVITPWLENEEYPKILASADLGICLHTSSSGLDLPMKIVDMFGCGLPVCAYEFNCLSELVRHDENGLVFASDAELASQLKRWFRNFPNNEYQHGALVKFQQEINQFQENRWHGNWACAMLPCLTEAAHADNNRPIIGVLAQEISYHLNRKYPGQFDSYIAASYVKFIEGAGARVVPIWIGRNESYYDDILSKINGVLWPGGATYFNQSNGYADAGAIIYRIAKRMNENGDYFPILGICLGFELLTYVAANRAEHRIDCSSINQPLPLEFKPNFQHSVMFGNAPTDVIEILRGANVTANYHQYCVTEKGLAQVGLSNEFHVLSLNNDVNGVRFISSLEHTSFPFYGVQFHPEKNIYEWDARKKIPHGRKSTRVAQYFADFFVNQARRNRHRFPSTNEEALSLIYNYPVTYTGLKKSSFVQCYMFKSNGTVIAGQ